MNLWNHIDLFSGANAFRMGFDEAGFIIGKHYYSEIDKHAIANTRYNYPESEYIGSVTDVSGLRPEGRTFITFGWPCQDNSIAGKRKGHAAGTRSGLLFEAVRLIDEIRPEFFVAENVEGLRTVNKGIDIVEAIKYLAFLNESLPQYDVEMQLLNTRWFLPQNRERLYFVGHLRNGCSRQVFPIGENDFRASKRAAKTPVVSFTAGGNSGGMHSGMNLICDSGQGRKLEERNIMPPLRANTGAGHGNYIQINCLNPGESQSGRVYGSGGIAPALYSGKQGVSGNSAIKITNRPHGFFKGSVTEVCPTFNAQSSKDNLYVNGIRRLTPIEAERLQGWPDNHTQFGVYEKQVWINKKERTFKIVQGVQQISDTQRYRMCGNGVSEPCVRAVATKLHSLYNLQSPKTNLLQ